MKRPRRLRVILLKPSKYDPQGWVERFRWGFMPNSTLPYMRSLTPDEIDGCQIAAVSIDEYVQPDLGYLNLLQKADSPTLLALVGVQSHQFHRALDLAAFAKQRGVEHCVIGGPHPMTCQTTELEGRGVSFAIAEAEVVWLTILRDAMAGELHPLYGEHQRWQKDLDSPVLICPGPSQLRRYVVPMLGIYPARGCPFICNFCSVIKIAGRRIRSQTIETTLESLRRAKRAGIKLIMFTSDNFNKYPDARDLLRAMIDEDIRLPFFVQCDTQIAKDEEMVELLGRAWCSQIFVGVESFDRATLKHARKAQNNPAHYADIIHLCAKHGITTHFSNIIAFPEQNEAAILEHLNLLRKLRPSVASFYILTPCPGTEQYDDFLRKGLITERNLDRTDGTALLWRHPHLSESRAADLLFRCYREFFALPDVFSKSLAHRWKDEMPWTIRRFDVGYSLFARFAAYRRMHPMSGGIGRRLLDSVKDYMELRRKRYGFDLVPLPANRELSAADQELSRPGLTRLLLAS